nr:MAG TPA: hypothetical protein [Bacteriophage sp.]DAV71228.1 MAG TPA: hypothetical protein [Bacteriophage sp.]
MFVKRVRHRLMTHPLFIAIFLPCLIFGSLFSYNR